MIYLYIFMILLYLLISLVIARRSPIEQQSLWQTKLFYCDAAEEINSNTIHDDVVVEKEAAEIPFPTTEEAIGVEEDAFIPEEAEEHEEETQQIMEQVQNSTLKKRGRFNFASFDCGAIIRASNAEAKLVTAILQENKDTYLLNSCLSQQFIVIELCEEILIEDVEIGNLEFFSSTFKHVDMFISDRFPEKQWTKLLSVKGKNLRQVQTFHVGNPQHWTKYVKLEFKSHYGSEYYCPVTIVRVYGRTVMEDLRTDGGDADEQQQQQHQQQHKYEYPKYAERVVVDAANPFPWLNEQSWPSLPSIADFAAGGDEVPLEQQPQQPQQQLDGGKDSVLKSMMKRLARLEQNVTYSQIYMNKQHKKLHELYLELELTLKKRIESFLDTLGRKVYTSVEDMRTEYETLFDRLIWELRKTLGEVRTEIKSIRSETDYLSSQVTTLQRWSIFQVLFIIVFWRFRRRFNRIVRLVSDKFEIPDKYIKWLFEVDKEDIQLKKPANPKRMGRRRSLPNLNG